MRLLVVVPLLLLCGCSAIEPREIDAVPKNKSAYAVLHYSAPNSARVRIFEIYASDGGLGVTDYGQLAEPVYLAPGKVKVTYCCPGAQSCSYENIATVSILSTGNHYLFCTSDGGLSVGKLKSGT